MDGLRIGDLARIAGVTPRTIRHYESLGLVSAPKRSLSGYRQYEPSAVLAIAEIRRLRALGMSLANIARARADGREAASLLDRLESLKKGIDEEIANLEACRRSLDELEDAVDRGDAILSAGEPEAYDSVRSILIDVGATARALDEARRLLVALESLAMPDEWTSVINGGLELVGRSQEACRAWADALDLIAEVRDLSVDDPGVRDAGLRLAKLAAVGAETRSLITFKTPAAVAIASVVASCFSPAQIAAFVIAATDVGALS